MNLIERLYCIQLILEQHIDPLEMGLLKVSDDKKQVAVSHPTLDTSDICINDYYKLEKLKAYILNKNTIILEKE